ncbi:MAG: UDP-N-acetylmuramate--L-alanine ligase [bacterium]
MVGISGIGMSAIAKILISMGYPVTGSSDIANERTRELSEEGVEISIPHSADSVAGSAVVVRTAAVRDDNPEIEEAKRRGITVLKYSEMLGFLMKEKKGIAIAGTHGKTTTTAMVGGIFQRAGLDPTIICGGIMKDFGSNGKYGTGEHFIAEACEYDGSFLNLSPFAAIVTNIDDDHLDYYGNLEAANRAFSRFISLLPPDGLAVVCGDDDGARMAGEARSGRKVHYGFGEENEWRLSEVETDEGWIRFDVLRGGEILRDFRLRVPGAHNALNALGATALSCELGVDWKVCRDALRDFKGVGRRFDEVGRINGAPVIDDYAHHPTAIRVTLRSARERYPKARIWCVFQPHQFSRTRHLLKDFATSFSDADSVILTDIYAQRDSEEDKRLISAETLANEVNAHHANVTLIKNMWDIPDFLKDKVGEGDVIITMGAGDIYKIADAIISPVEGDLKQLPNA